MLVTKVTRGEVKVLDAETGRVSAIASSESQDRDGDVIRAEGWNLDNFMKHPILLSSHNYGSVRSQIGEWESLEVKGKKLVGVAKYYIGEGNEEADWAFKLAGKGRAAYSVGFIPDMEKAEKLKGGYDFKSQELLEVSHVTVPSNPTALQLARMVNQDPVLKELIDEEMSEAMTQTDEHGNPTYSQQAVDAGIRALARAVLAEIGMAYPGAGNVVVTPSPTDSAPVTILDILGVE